MALLAMALLVGPAHGSSRDYASVKEEAERLYAEKSYARAHALYAESLPPAIAEQHWVAFRLADTRWRMDPEGGSEEAQRELSALLESVPHPLWMEIQESLGDSWWVPRRQWHRAWPHYQAALGGWAESRDLERARKRYLGLVDRIARPEGSGLEPYRSHGGALPLDVLENALSLARSDRERARFRYLIATSLRSQGDWNLQHRIPAAFEAALEAGRSTPWYDDALYQYAEWLHRHGRPVIDEGGGTSYRPDFHGALELYRRLVAEFDEGESRYRRQARGAIEEITSPRLAVMVSNVFLPGSEIEFELAARNLEVVNFELHPVQLDDALDLRQTRDASDWIEGARLGRRRPLRSWSRTLDVEGDHAERRERIRLEAPLETGAYVVSARSGDQKARALLLVSDVALIVKASGEKLAAFLCDASSGEPLEGGAVVFWTWHGSGERHVVRRLDGTTGEDGLAVVKRQNPGERLGTLVVARSGARQAVAHIQAPARDRRREDWRIYAFTDRPAYRPGETVQWKALARVGTDGRYTTPSGERIGYRIEDPRGTRVSEGTLLLNDFGSGFGELALDGSMVLGPYRVDFTDQKQKRGLGSAVLFRLEEYKLPEYRVEVAAVGGRQGSHRSGEPVEVEIRAAYYFGGPVAGARVEAIVQQRGYHPIWSPPRAHTWMESIPPSRGFGSSQTIGRHQLATDAEGVARLRIDTTRFARSDSELTIEARVVDASRREVIGRGSLRVTHRPWFVFLHPERRVHRVGDVARVNVRAQDANEQPVAIEGQVTVTRERWREIWLDPAGQEVSGEPLAKLRAELTSFPPPRRRDEPPWRLRFRGYQPEPVLTRELRTGKDGALELRFPVEQEGYYRITWVSEPEDAVPVRAEAFLFGASDQTRDLHYQGAGVEILVDPSAVEAGRPLPVLLHATSPGRFVLFSVEGEDLYDLRLVPLDGHDRLIEIEVAEHFVPNVFLAATSVAEFRVEADREELSVPPTRQILDLRLAADREEYRPGEKGIFTVTSRDAEGKPVSAEIALAVADESVFAIQGELAEDPRAFFHGRKRPQRVQTRTSLDLMGFSAWLEPEPVPTAPGSSRVRRHIDINRLSEGRADVPEASQQLRALGYAVAEADTSSAGGVEPAAVQVRHDFRSTALWIPDLVTDDRGEARVEVPFPDSLTGWRATARAADRRTRVGLAHAAVRTRKPLLVRLETPRFLVVGDVATLSASIHNHTDQKLSVTSSLVVSGLSTEGGADSLSVPAHGEGRMEWTASAKEAGEASLEISVRGKSFSDAMRRTLPVYEHGIEKLETASGKLRGAELRAQLTLPERRRSTRLELRVAPSLAVAMLDALPYLIDYPYGCTEQTMSRFLPAVITARTLAELGLRREDVVGRVFGGIEPEHAGKTHPRGSRDLDELDAVVRSGLARLADFQHGDGGFGWWKPGDSDPFMTAYVVWGLVLAGNADVAVDEKMFERAVHYLGRSVVEKEDQLDTQAWMLHALAAHRASTSLRRPSEPERVAFENIFRRREELNVYSRALLTLTAHSSGRTKEAATLVRNLENGVKTEGTPVTRAHWGEAGIRGRWSEGGVEATAFALRALLAVAPEHPLVEPAATWLIENRRGAQWKSTRDTAIVLLALNDYLRVSGELEADLDFAIYLNDRLLAERSFTSANVLDAPSRLEVDPAWLRDGENEIRIVRTRGESPLYLAAEARFFSLEEPITKAGERIAVAREYLRLAPQPTLLAGPVYDRVPVGDGDRVQSGVRIETALTIEAKNHFEYLMFEDLKPAGFEAVAVRSGETLRARRRGGSDERPVYAELRDRKLALFIDQLPEGTWEIKYELRAQTPGAFHALPLIGQAMYVPEIRANGAEVRLRVE
jgi:uncharacterized protein YfaS (alpha-2-macroglobulin family)